MTHQSRLLNYLSLQSDAKKFKKKLGFKKEGSIELKVNEY